jgi:competence protein ComEC
LLLTAISVVGVILSLRRAWLALALGLAAVASFLIAPRWISVLAGGRWPPPDWIVAQCDVGQGSSTLIRSGVDRAVIVDTGPDPALVDTCLRRTGVRVLDLVVITPITPITPAVWPGRCAAGEARRSWSARSPSAMTRPAMSLAWPPRSAGARWSG